MPSAKEQAEKIAVEAIHWRERSTEANTYTNFLRFVDDILLTTRREALAETTAILKGLMDEKRKCSPHYTGHDDRWCEVCESMEDAYGYALTKLEALAAEEDR